MSFRVWASTALREIDEYNWAAGSAVELVRVSPSMIGEHLRALMRSLTKTDGVGTTSTAA
jgi:hypothetical protein